MGWFCQRFELSRGGDGSNVRSMEGLRGFAIFLVFWVHCCTLGAPWLSGHQFLTKMAVAMHAMGNAGVDLFFVLSGYLIYGSLISRPQAFKRFMARRFRRIYPVFIVMFSAYVLLSFVFPSESKIPPWPLPAVIYLLQNLLFLPGIFPIEPLISAAWSLSYEMFYYLAIPLLIAVLGLRERSPAWRMFIFIAMAAAILGLAAVWSGPVRLVMFLSGMVLFEACKFGQVDAPPAWMGMLALLLGLLSTSLPMEGAAGFAVRIGILFIAFFLLCLSCFRDGSHWLARGFCWTPLRWLGNMSYSYYLMHGLALKFAFLVLSTLTPVSRTEPWYVWTMVPVLFAWTLLPSAVLFLVVERPLSLVAERATVHP